MAAHVRRRTTELESMFMFGCRRLYKKQVPMLFHTGGIESGYILSRRTGNVYSERRRMNEVRAIEVQRRRLVKRPRMPW